MRAIEEACLAGGATLHGSGIPRRHRALPADGVVVVRGDHAAEEFSDLRTYNAPLVVREVMGFGLTPDQAMGGPIATLLEAGFKASVRMITDELGFDAEQFGPHTQEVAVAVRGTGGFGGADEPGMVAARRFRWEAIVDDRPVVTAIVNWLMCGVELDPAVDPRRAGPRRRDRDHRRPERLADLQGTTA